MDAKKLEKNYVDDNKKPLISYNETRKFFSLLVEYTTHAGCWKNALFVFVIS